MPYGLKNAGFTYQRMVTRMFENKLGKNVEACINNMVVSKEVSEHLTNLDENFAILRRHNVCLNASKCFFFGVRFGKLLGYMITH